MHLEMLYAIHATDAGSVSEIFHQIEFNQSYGGEFCNFLYLTLQCKLLEFFNHETFPKFITSLHLLRIIDLYGNLTLEVVDNSYHNVFAVS